jgi:hypothetical protein
MNTVKSKTFWAGIIALAISMLSAASSQQLVVDNPNIASGVAVVVSVLTFALGVFTPRPARKE